MKPSHSALGFLAVAALIGILEWNSAEQEGQAALNNQRTKLAKTAGVGHVVLNHIVPPLPLHPLREIFLGKAPEVFNGPFRIGEDGDLISLPSGTKEVVYSRR